MIVQYNTSSRWSPLKASKIGPYPFQIGRKRVSEEDAVPTLLHPEHSLLQGPNIINLTTFDGWVQERGLYFPNQWDAAFTPILSMKDEDDEQATQGALLVAPYGKGHYIYTGLSFFRELPAGVPGAYKLFANMLSIGKSEVESESAIKG